jgi:hypothetical protein
MTPVARGNESGYLQTLSFPKTHSPLAPAAEYSQRILLLVEYADIQIGAGLFNHLFFGYTRSKFHQR